MYTATAQIDVTRPAERKLVREIENAKVEYPLLTVSGKSYTLDEIREMGYNKLSEYYGVDVRTL